MRTPCFSLIAVFCLTWSLVIESREAQTATPAPVAFGAGNRYTEPPTIPAPPQGMAEGEWIQGAEGEIAQYSLDDLLSLATQHNPTLLQAKFHISAELGKALQAGLYPNPTFSYEGEQIFIDIDGDTDSPGEFQGGIIQQRIVTAGKLRLSREKYLRRAHVSEHLAIAQQFRVCNDVRIHFYRALAAVEALVIRRELLQTAEDIAVTAQESHNMGQARRSEVRRANVMLQRARLELLNAENVSRESFRRLTSLVGIPLPAGELVGDLMRECPVVSFDEAYARLIAESPEMAAARAKLAVDQATVQRERVEWIPDVVVRGGTGYNFEAKETTAVAGVAIQVPLYDRNQGTVRQANADYARQRQEIERLTLRLRDQMAATYQEYLTALQHVREYDRVILPELKAAYAELLASYRANRVDWPDVLDMQLQYFDARLTQVDNLLRARTKEVLIYGYLLHDGLMAAPGMAPPGHIDAVPKPR